MNFGQKSQKNTAWHCSNKALHKKYYDTVLGFYRASFAQLLGLQNSEGTKDRQCYTCNSGKSVQ